MELIRLVLNRLCFINCSKNNIIFKKSNFSLNNLTSQKLYRFFPEKTIVPARYAKDLSFLKVFLY